jgi:hypothetical protein
MNKYSEMTLFELLNESVKYLIRRFKVLRAKKKHKHLLMLKIKLKKDVKERHLNGGLIGVASINSAIISSVCSVVDEAVKYVSDIEARKKRDERR